MILKMTGTLFATQWLVDIKMTVLETPANTWSGSYRNPGK